MMTKLLHEHAGLRTYAVILEIGDEAMACLQDFARKEQVTGARLSAIGAFREAVLLYFDWGPSSTGRSRSASRSRSRRSPATSASMTKAPRRCTSTLCSAGTTERLWRGI